MLSKMEIIQNGKCTFSYDREQSKNHPDNPFDLTKVWYKKTIH